MPDGETLLINGFIVQMLFILWSWDLPEHSRLKQLVERWRRPIQWLGLAHTWSMFAPDPAQDNYRLLFKLCWSDGSAVVIEPEYLRAPHAQRGPVQYRWLKLKRSLLRAENALLRASVCHYVAAEYLAQPAADAPAQLIEVQLIRVRQALAPFTAPDAGEPCKRRVIFTQPMPLLSAKPSTEASAAPAPPLHLCLE